MVARPDEVDWRCEMPWGVSIVSVLLRPRFSSTQSAAQPYTHPSSTRSHTCPSLPSSRGCSSMRLDAAPTTALAHAGAVLDLARCGARRRRRCPVGGAGVFVHQVGEVLVGILLGVAAEFRWATGRWDKVRKI